MAIQIADGFQLRVAKPLDDRQNVETVAQLDPTYGYEGQIVYVKDVKQFYTCYKDENGSLAYKVMENGGGGSSEEQIKDWVSGSSYLVGDYIYHEGEIYRCVASNNDVDFDEVDWKQLTYGIDDTEVRLDKTHSSFKIYQDIQQCLNDSKAYTLEELEKVKIDDTLTTTDKTVTGAINEVNGNLLDTIEFSADYKNIILNRKNGLNPYTIPIGVIINNASLAELKDVDSTDVGNGKILVYDGATNKHKYVDSSITDEFVKMDSATDAKYLSDLIDKSTVVNDNGVLKVKKLDGQEVTITEINYLKGLTMNVMDLVNAFSNGGVKVWETPVNTYSDLSTLDRSAFIEGISYIVYVLADETHSGAKTTYLCTKTSTTFFGNADNQRNFTTNPIDLANEVTGKLGTSNIDVDNLWTLLTINDTYKTLTTNNEIFGTHGAKAMYDELATAIGKKANTSDIPTKVSELTNDSNYQTAKQVNSAVTTEIAKVETEVKGNIEEINDSLVDKQDFRIFKSLEEFNEKKGTSFTAVSGVDNMVDIANAMSEGDMLIIATKDITGSEIYFGLDSSAGWIKMFTLTRIGGLCDIKCTTSAVKNLTRVLAGSTLTTWQELATMDKVPESVANPAELDVNKFNKNGYYSIGDARSRTNLPVQQVGTLLVFYAGHYVIQEYILNENQRIFIRRSTDKGANWSAWRELATATTVADVGVTTITPVNSAITGTIEYTVKNGICYVSLRNVKSTTTSNGISISTTMPKPAINSSSSIVKQMGGGNIGFVYINKNTTQLTVNVHVSDIVGDCSFSYPVAE